MATLWRVGLLTLLWLGATHVNAASSKKFRFQINMKDAGITSLSELPTSIDIAGIDTETGTFDVIGSEEYFSLLQDSGYNVKMLEAAPSRLDSNYLDPKEIYRIAHILQNEYPELVHVKEIGKSLKGFPLIAVRVTTPDNIPSKPTVFFNGMHHAREIMTTEVTTDIIIYLAKNYNNPDTPWVTDALEQLSIWVLPQVNPDGNQIVWSSDSWWRKNARGNEDSTWGVDINRNYSYDWGKCNGSSGSKGNDTYRGEKAASEPETRALMNLAQEINPMLSISYHSYSELVIAPYGCNNKYTPEKSIVHFVGQGLAKKLVRDNGSGTYTFGEPWDILYPVDGDDVSWLYNELSTLSYVVEVNSSSQGFQPDYKEWRDPTVSKQRAGWKYMIERALHGAQVRGTIRDSNTQQLIEGQLLLENVKYRDEKPRRSRNGHFAKLLMPGEYEIRFFSEGYEPQTISVSIGDEVLNLDVFLDKKLDVMLGLK